MKNKTTRKPVRKPKASRDTVTKRIAAAAKTNALKALAFANYGSEAEAVLNRMASRNDPDAFRPLNIEAGLSRFIQGWLLLGDSKTDSFYREQSDLLAWKRGELQKEMLAYFSDALERGKWIFIHDFADKLKAEVNYRDAAMLKNRSPIHAALLARKLSKTTVNLSELARRENVSPRSVWEVNRKIGAKTLSRGRPRK